MEFNIFCLDGFYGSEYFFLVVFLVYKKEWDCSRYFKCLGVGEM